MSGQRLRLIILSKRSFAFAAAAAAAKEVFGNVSLKCERSEKWTFPREHLWYAFWCLSPNKWAKRHKFAFFDRQEVAGKQTLLFLANPSRSNLLFNLLVSCENLQQQRFVIFAKPFVFINLVGAWTWIIKNFKPKTFWGEQTLKTHSTPKFVSEFFSFDFF